MENTHHTCPRCFATFPSLNLPSRFPRWMLFASPREVRGLQGEVQGHLVQRGWVASQAVASASLCLPRHISLPLLNEQSRTPSHTLNLYFLASSSKMDTLITDHFFLVIVIIKNTFFSVFIFSSAYYRNKALPKTIG